MAFNLLVNRKKFHDYKLDRSETKSASDLSRGQVLLEVQRFSFTSNNITYAAVGEVVGYWRFFPAEGDWGIIPVWGFADVVASEHDSIAVGDRYYGYFPMGSHLVVEPQDISAYGFKDGAAHRVGLPAIYNSYINVANDLTYSQETEGVESIFRPLFATSFLLDDYLDDQDYFHADQVILTSASSKTALALAHLLALRESKIEVIALTSEQNMDFVKGTGYYQTVYSYDQIESTELRASVIADFSGNERTQERIQAHLGDHLKFNSLIGMVDWTRRGGPDGAATNGKFFFAPHQAAKRSKDWGVPVLNERLGSSMKAFLEDVPKWMTQKTHHGTDELMKLYPEMLDGHVDPSIGHVVVLDHNG